MFFSYRLRWIYITGYYNINKPPIIYCITWLLFSFTNRHWYEYRPLMNGFQILSYLKKWYWTPCTKYRVNSKLQISNIRLLIVMMINTLIILHSVNFKFIQVFIQLSECCTKQRLPPLGLSCFQLLTFSVPHSECGNSLVVQKNILYYLLNANFIYIYIFN